MKTKVVHCGKTIWVYDCNTKYSSTQLSFEKKENQLGLLDIKRYIYTNFLRDSSNFAQVLMLPFETTDLSKVKIDFKKFINELEKSTGQKNMEYLAVVDLPNESSMGTIYCLFNTDIGYMPQEDEMPWDGDSFITLTPATQLLEDFSEIFIAEQSRTNCTSIILKDGLRKPIIKLGEEAEEYLMQFNIHEQDMKYSKGFHDRIGGNTRVYEYYLEKPY